MTALTLRVADTFFARLRGVHAGGPLAEDEAMLIRPCRAIHTFFLSYSLDVVFLDAHGRVCRSVECLPPGRMVFERGAFMVVELPAGYCASHPDYPARIHAALRLRESPRLSL